MTRAEKAGLKVYPENISYSTIGDTMYDYNAEKRRVFIEGYEQGCKDTIDHPSGGELLHVLNKGVKQGYKDAIRKALEWWKEELTYPSMSAEEIAWIDAKIKDFKKFMEEQE